MVYPLVVYVLAIKEDCYHSWTPLVVLAVLKVSEALVLELTSYIYFDWVNVATIAND